MRVGRRQVEADLQPACTAGLDHFAEDVALAAFPGRRADAVFRGLGLPPAESGPVLGHEDDIFRILGHAQSANLPASKFG